MNRLDTRILVLLGAGTFGAASAGAQSVLFSDSFETNSSADYTIVNDGTPDGTQTFAFDYVAAGIPLAPRSGAGEFGGLRLTANDTLGAVDAWTVFHNTSVSEPHYRLTVDVWMNFDAPAGSTEHAHVGIGGDGATFNSLFTPISGSGAFIAFDGDGGSASDYRWFRAPANTPPGETDNTTLPNSHPSYLGHGSNNSGPFFQSLFPSPPSTIAGSPGNIWTTVEIEVNQLAGVISFYFDGMLTFEGNFAGSFDGLVSLGIADVFTSVSGASNVFTLYDNLLVESISGFIGTNFCGPAAPNSTGLPGVMTAVGSVLVADNNVTLTANSLPNGAFGYFLTSMTQGTSTPAGSQGTLCLTNVGRYVGPGQVMNTGTAGSFSLALDLTQTPTPTALVAINAGETWSFQAWHRDANPFVTSNFTDGLEITFQ